MNFQKQCLHYLWRFRVAYPGNLQTTLLGFAVRHVFYRGLIFGGWGLALLLLATVLRPLFDAATPASLHVFDAFTLFLMPVLLVGLGRFGQSRTQAKWRRLRRKAILEIRMQRRARGTAGPVGGAVFSAGRIH